MQPTDHRNTHMNAVPATSLTRLGSNNNREQRLYSFEITNEEPAGFWKRIDSIGLSPFLPIEPFFLDAFIGPKNSARVFHDNSDLLYPKKIQKNDSKTKDTPSERLQPNVTRDVPPNNSKATNSCVTRKRPGRPPRRLRSFQFSAKDFVPRRNDKFEDHYELSDMLGEGAWGEVYKCKSKHQVSAPERAVKIIEKNRMVESEYEVVINEFQILKSIDNPNIIRMYEFFDTNDKFYIVQELVKGGELFDVVEDCGGRLPEQDAALLMKQVLSSVKYLAQNHVVHRDLNLENILLEANRDYEQIKIIDFGLATTFDPDGPKLTEIVGKVAYLAPEVLEQQYGPKYDVWSAGVMAFKLLTGYQPFDAESEADVRYLIAEGKIYWDDPEWNDVSPEGKDFVAKLLAYDEAARPTAEEALKHPWIVNAIQRSSEVFRRRASSMATEALSNLRSFSVSSKLKQAACSFITSQLLEKEERESIDLIFRGLDDDCDGKLSMDDLQNKFKELNDSELSLDELNEVFEKVDQSGSGYIDYSEFVMATMKASDLFDEKKLKAAFDNFDTDKSGYIRPENLKESLAYCCSYNPDQWDDSIVDKIMKQVGNESGSISFDDFKILMNPAACETERTADETLVGSHSSLLV